MITPLDQIAKAAFEKLAADARRECDVLQSRVAREDLSAQDLVALAKLSGEIGLRSVPALKGHLSDST